MEALEWDSLRNGSLLPTLSPAVPPYVKLGLTVAYTVFYSLLFLFIYIQLWLVLHYRHKRFSYQTVFLFLCLLWASLRTVLFSFYFKDFVAANSLSPFAFWLLYCFPVCLQFFTLTLMNLYFTQGSSVCQLTTIGATVILLYSSRACYNLVILSFSQSKAMNSFDYDWYNVSDQANLKCQLGDAGYVVFGIILFVWELLPTSLVVFFFRVRNPTKDLTNPGIVPTHAFNPRSYFFDNPRRYDSDDDLAWSISPHSIYGSFSPESCDWGYLNNSFMVQVRSLQHDFISESERPSPM
ncbi:integral membrane protein GPR137B isoform X3 [Candoia aspera]|uniref:integral membrane protein GPR137B isoform X3 n=1 Tax=Candoia aspera TaxID=51853 RepID=UPI002FD7C270